jgi:tetratricopeptide (TPR) repeat protein
LAAADPHNAEAQRDLSLSYENLGDVNIQSGNAPAALQYYEKHLKITQQVADADPHAAFVQRDLLVSYSKLGDVHLKLGSVPVAHENYEKSMKIAAQLAKADLRNAEAQADFGYCCGRLGVVEKSSDRFRAAAKWFELAVAIFTNLDQEGKSAGQSLNQHWFKDGKWQLQLCNAATRVIDDLQFALAQPKDMVPELLAIRGRALARRGAHADAAATAEKLRAIGPTAGNNLYMAAGVYSLCSAAVASAKLPAVVPADEKQLQERYAARGVELLKQSEAAGYFQDADNRVALQYDHNLDPIRGRDDFKKLLAARMNKGSKGECDKAIADCNEAIRLEPKVASGYFYRGLAWETEGEDGKAIADLDTAISIDPRFPEAHYNRGLARQAMAGEGEAAAYAQMNPGSDAAKIIKALDEPTEMDFIDTPLKYVVDSLKVRHGIKIQLDTKALADAGVTPDTTIVCVIKGISLRSALRLMLAERDMAYTVNHESLVVTSDALQRAEYDRAIADFGDAIRLDPKDADAYLYRGRTWEQMDEHEKAIADFGEAISLNPQLLAAYYNRGLTQLAVGNETEAFADFRKAGVDPVKDLGTATAKIIKALDEPTEVDFVDTPLKDVVDSIKSRHGIAIQLDMKALLDAGMTPDTTITKRLKGMSLRSALRLMLADKNLKYVISNEVPQITSTAKKGGA